MTTTSRPPRLTGLVIRRLLTVDAAGCLLLGLVAVVSAGASRGPLGAPTTVLLVGGLVLLAYGVGAAVVVRGTTPGRLLALAGANGAFIVGCAAVALTQPLSGAGLTVAIALAVVSAVMTEVLGLGARGTSRS